MRIKIALLTVIFILFILITSCMLVPDCALDAYVIDWDETSLPDLTIECWMDNVGRTDLTNVQIHFMIYTTSGNVDGWSHETFDVQTSDGNGQSYFFDFNLADDFSINPADVTDVRAIGEGWDNPPDN